MEATYSILQINTDGGSRGNPGPSAIGVSATSDQKVIFQISKYIGETTNNVAEYTAVIEALKHLSNNNISAEKIVFVLDSELIVRQITGVYKVKQAHLLNLKTEVVKTITELKNKNVFKTLEFQNVLREKNKDADKLVNEALDKK